MYLFQLMANKFQMTTILIVHFNSDNIHISVYMKIRSMLVFYETKILFVRPAFLIVTSHVTFCHKFSMKQFHMFYQFIFDQSFSSDFVTKKFFVSLLTFIRFCHYSDQMMKALLGMGHHIRTNGCLEHPDRLLDFPRHRPPPRPHHCPLG